MALQLEKRPPRFVCADLTWISDLVQVTFLDMNSHLSSSLELIATDIL